MTENDQDGILDEAVPEESEQLDQLDQGDSLIDRGIDDALDEGYIAPDGWSPAQGYGNTAEEMRAGETLEQRVKQEIPEPDPAKEPAEGEKETLGREVGNRRAGRLIDANDGYQREDHEARLLGRDVGIDGAAASAEEAAMHVIDEDDIDAEDIDDIDSGDIESGDAAKAR